MSKFESLIEHEPTLSPETVRFAGGVAVEASVRDLSEREKEILQLVAEGLQSKEISEGLFVAEETVKTHRRHILMAYDVANTAAAVKEGLLRGDVELKSGEPAKRKLTNREKEVLGLIADGLLNKEIAASLYIQKWTVKKHIDHILEALVAENRSHAVYRAYQVGEFEPPTPEAELEGLLAQSPGSDLT